MTSIKITRPAFPPGYVDNPASTLTWDWVASQLTESKHCHAPKPDSWDQGGLFVFTLKQGIAWSSFTKDPTKFIFEA